jgi:hypothetical protein
MHEQIADLIAQLHAATAEGRVIVGSHPPEVLASRPAEGRWSAVECISHLVVTSEGYVPLMSGALKANVPVGGTLRYKMDAPGWLIARSLEPPVRLRARTVHEFLPRPFGSATEALARFEELQEGTERVLESAEGYDLNRIMLVSPFNRRVRYNLYSCFQIVLAHQRRHLWQARRAIQRQQRV